MPVSKQLVWLVTFGKKVDELYLTGLAGDICVYATVMDSLGEKFKPFIIEDATRPLSEQDYKKAKKQFIENGGRVIQRTELVVAFGINKTKTQ